MTLTVEEITVRFGERIVLDGLSMTVADGEVVGVLGPSGCGKSTLLRVVAGLLVPDAGAVCWDGTDLMSLPLHRRGVGLVFQDGVLFPHRDVGANVAFGLRMQRSPKTERAAEVSRLLMLVGLPGYERRAVATLSGGEAQRVALARALAPRPRVLLLDEPLASLDLDLRRRLAADLATLLHTLGTTALFVTHDPAEADAVADRTIRLG